MNKRNCIILIVLTLTGLATHLLPHSAGFSTVGTLGMLVAAYLPIKLLAIPVLITIGVADFINGIYALSAMFFVYLAHLSATFILAKVLKCINPYRIIVATILNAVVFYLISNIAPMVMGYYPATVEGWLLCYTNGLPFLWRGILANLVFAGFAFALISAFTGIVNSLRSKSKISLIS